MSKTESPLIAARLTPQMPSGIATIAVFGDEAPQTILRLANLRTKELQVHRIHYGTWPMRQDGVSSSSASGSPSFSASSSFSTSSGEIGEEQVVVCRTQPKVVELHCHGGNAICRTILSQLASAGCKEVSSEAWPSTYKGQIARQAESDLLRAKTDKVAAVLVRQLNGAFEEEVISLVRMLDTISSSGTDSVGSHVLTGLESRIEQLLENARFGIKLIDGWNVVFAGPPNVGKSSLINRIVGQTRSIVHSEAGTTRDWVESQAVIEGWPVCLTDTAGIREAVDFAEREGVARAQERIRQADLVVLVVDAGEGWTETHSQIASLKSGRSVICLNKWDVLPPDQQVDAANMSASTIEPLLAAAPQEICEDPVVLASATTNPGVVELMQKVHESLMVQVPLAESAVPFRKEHGDALEGGLQAVKLGSWQEARGQLESILTGEPELRC